MDNLAHFIDNNSLCDKVYEFLRDQILSGNLRPETRLPETELAASMNVSRAPIREALNMLCNDGFVVKVPRHGAMVAPVTRKEIEDNWELRKLIEPYAAKEASGRIPKEELLKIKKLITDASAAGNYDLYMDSDYRTHSVIYQYVPNSQLQNVLKQAMLNSMRYRFYVENNHPTYGSIIKTVCDEHLSLVDALLNEDADLVYETMKQHIENGHDRFEEYFMSGRKD